MAEIQIKAESFPQRCEICHQTDCFDVKNNYCSRCENAKDLYGEKIYYQLRANQSIWKDIVDLLKFGGVVLISFIIPLILLLLIWVILIFFHWLFFE
jgi:hypothetical protein